MRASAEAPYAALAQLVEHRIRNAGVVGSNPIGGTIFPIFSVITQSGLQRKTLPGLDRLPLDMQ
jgi:hypothetical protein